MLCEMGTIGGIVRFGYALSTRNRDKDAESTNLFESETFCPLVLKEENKEKIRI